MSLSGWGAMLGVPALSTSGLSRTQVRRLDLGSEGRSWFTRARILLGPPSKAAGLCGFFFNLNILWNPTYLKIAHSDMYHSQENLGMSVHGGGLDIGRKVGTSEYP